MFRKYIGTAISPLTNSLSDGLHDRKSECMCIHTYTHHFICLPLDQK